MINLHEAIKKIQNAKRIGYMLDVNSVEGSIKVYRLGSEKVLIEDIKLKPETIVKFKESKLF